ncbi:hypothetical protein LAZ67_15000998 [Cordylochernes scorpioides]|uniref:Mos1 transposase HTH domain-containing protein n=1 Tax=Cordylochernes scorpioides TaxID=51811 RepID=A0ABY6L8F8_9ARAC|nr:hypothetical protein LAZ67_15000998 [Cordylochernes scorpioides]
MLTVAYGEATLDRSNVYRWYKMFSEGREDMNDEERAGRPSTSTTDEKINEVEKMILANRRITVKEVAEDLNISIGSCHSIFINDLGMRRVAAIFVPKLLNCNQKQHRMNMANEMLDSVRGDPNLLQRVITGDEAWRSQDITDFLVRRADRIVDAKGRGEDSKEPMESDPDFESGKNTTFPKMENTLGRTQEIPLSQEDATPPPAVSDVLGNLTRTLHQLSAATGLSRDVELPRYDGSYEAQSFFDNYDAQADLAQLQYTEKLRRLPNLLQGIVAPCTGTPSALNGLHRAVQDLSTEPQVINSTKELCCPHPHPSELTTRERMLPAPLILSTPRAQRKQ